MPVYEYRCKDCGKTHEIEHGFHDARPTSCPSCNGHLVRVFHPVGVVFKGSGFHKTDYSASGVRKEPAKEPASDKSSSADSKTATKKTGETTTTQKAEKGTSETSTQSKSPDAKPPTGSSKT